MYSEPRQIFLSRRGLLLVAGAGLAGWTRLAAASGNFWDKKAPSDWNSEEIDKLITKSPWAKEASATAPAGQNRQNPNSGGNPQGGGYPGGYPGRYPGGGGVPGMGYPRRRYPGGGGRRTGTTYKGTVRWESAQPVLEARKTKLPEAFANHYVIAVVGFPAPGNRQQGGGNGDGSARAGRKMLDNIKEASSLQAKGKDRVDADIVKQESGSSSFLIGFSKALMPLTTADKEVDFETRLGRLAIKAKFVPKEMKYRGGLAL